MDLLDHAIQNGLDASDFASKRETPISRRIQSLRVINSLRERARRCHSVKQRFTWLQHVKQNVRGMGVVQFIVLILGWRLPQETKFLFCWTLPYLRIKLVLASHRGPERTDRPAVAEVDWKYLGLFRGRDDRRFAKDHVFMSGDWEECGNKFHRIVRSEIGP
jgi:hypothetical protein